MTTTNRNLTDGELIQLISQNNEVAIATFLDRYKDKFYTAIYFIVKDRDQAEDIFQDACIKIINIIRNGKYNEAGKFMPWAMRIIRNMAMDFLRLEKRFPKITLPDGKDIFTVLDFEEKPQKAMYDIEESGIKARALIQNLSLEQRETLILRIWGNLSFNEIAELTNVSLNTALGRMRYALLKLRKVVEEKEMVL